MEVTVSSLGGELFEFHLEEWETVAVLQRKVAETWSVFPGQVSLLASGIPCALTESTKLGELGVSHFEAVRCEYGALQCVDGSREGIVSCRDIRTGHVWRELSEHSTVVTCLATNFYNMLALTGCEDGILRLWNLSDGQLIRIFKHQDAVTCLQACFQTMRSVTGTDAGILVLWNLSSGEMVSECRLTLCPGYVASTCCLDVDFTQLLAISGSADDKLRLWDLGTSKCLHVFNDHRNYVQAVHADFDRMRAVSGSSDTTVKFWDLESRCCLLSMEGHTEDVSCVSVDFKSMYALSCGDDGLMILWSLTMGEQLRTFAGHEGRLVAVVADFSNARALTAARDNTIRLWDLTSGLCLHSISVDTQLTCLTAQF